jgi:hypothetical protein
MLFKEISFMLVNANKVLFDKTKELTIKHIDHMIILANKSDDYRGRSICDLSPTWEAMKKEIDKIKIE